MQKVQRWREFQRYLKYHSFYLQRPSLIQNEREIPDIEIKRSPSRSKDRTYSKEKRNDKQLRNGYKFSVSKSFNLFLVIHISVMISLGTALRLQLVQKLSYSLESVIFCICIISSFSKPRDLRNQALSLYHYPKDLFSSLTVRTVFSDFLTFEIQRSFLTF